MKAQKIIEQVLDEMNPELVISGGAIGIDQMAVAEARKRSIKIHEFLPKERKWGGLHGFRARNEKIAEACDILVSIRSTKAKTFGSGWTANYAQKIGKKVIRYETG